MKMNPIHVVLVIAGLLILGGITLFTAAAISQRVRWVPSDPAATPAARLSGDHWKTLGSRKLFFAHMSVGRNMLKGVEDLQRESSETNLVLRESSDPAAMTKPVLAHARLGHNGDPARKIESFRQLMDPLKSSPPDAAFMKFCYVDIRYDTDVPRLFALYTTAMDKLQAELPATRFAHLTVPLRSPPTGMNRSFKAPIKWLLGRPDTAADNLKREAFNQLLRERYAAKGELIDIAEAESSGPRGRCVTKRSGQFVSCLAPDYTSDGGHLNEAGCRRVAEVFLVRLAEIASK